jgi:DNA end-binding protein Ku
VPTVTPCTGGFVTARALSGGKVLDRVMVAQLGTVRQQSRRIAQSESGPAPSASAWSSYQSASSLRPRTTSIRFHRDHLKDQGRLRNGKVCEIEDREVSSAEIGKDHEHAKDQIVTVAEEELREFPLPTAKAIEIDAVAPADRIDPIQIGEGYFLVPEGQVAAKPYRLLRQALERQEKAAISKYVLSGRERLGMPRVPEKVIVLHSLRGLDQLRDPPELLPPVDVPGDKIEGALALVQMMSRDDLDHPECWDTYAEAVAKVIEAKREDRPLPEAPEPEKPGKVLDLMAALTQSVE